MSEIRLAMWSGPRNVSTALMRSFAQRPDTTVVDEPFYAYSLQRTGLDHPGREDVLRALPTDWRAVVRWITGPIPDGRSVWFQKHMAQHMSDEVDLAALDELTHAFLIRDPADVIRSYSTVYADMDLQQTGLPWQVRLFDRIRQRTGRVPPVIDARDLRNHPDQILSGLCAAIGLDACASMQSWPKGPQSTDGVWAPHWYSRVHESTGFRPYPDPGPPLPVELRSLEDEARSLYNQLYQHRLQPDHGHS